MTQRANTPRHSNPHMDHTNDLRNPSRNRHNARRAPLLLLIGLAALAVLVLISGGPRTVEAQSATGRPVVLASAEGAGILFADTEGIADGNGLPIVIVDSYATFTWSYQ